MDTGSETNLITLPCAQNIGLRISDMNSRIAGVGGNVDTQVIGCTCAAVFQRYGYPNLLIPFFVVPRVTLDLPSSPLPRYHWPHLNELDLADPQFHRPGPVDIIFSADVLHTVLLGDSKFSIRGSPNALQSTFGWLISGGYLPPKSLNVQFSAKVDVHEILKPEDEASEKISDCARALNSPVICPTIISLAPVSASHSSSLNANAPDYAKLLERMFCIESVDDYPAETKDELLAEEIFRKSVSRLSDGRFEVSLPFKTDPAKLGHSKSVALNRFKSLERRLSKSPLDKIAYNKFMRDYLDQKHMELAPPLSTGAPHYYIPHHSVRRPDDPPDKIRVVFNASQPTMSKLSLNDLLLPGPKLQLDTTDVLTRFRQDRWVFVADIKQMFRQISHPSSDRDFLRIIWRFDQNEPIQDYRLCTVTYGTTSAPFLSNRVLRELANLHSQSHPAAAHILQCRMYVDDLNGGSDDLQTALRIRKELQVVLSSAQLELRKWAANNLELLAGIPEDHLLPKMASVQLEEESDSSMKILGLSWQPILDAFHFVLKPMEKIQTKRQLASQIARMYDPLGWLMPLTVHARLIFRSVVQNHFGWDDPLPPSVELEWLKLAQELPDLVNLKIPRYVAASSEAQWIIGFSDASEKAYGAVVYHVSVLGDSTAVSLITSKARMAPIKAMTLPRLELCGAHLLAKTIHKIAPSLRNVRPDRVLALSDSEIVLSWLTAEPAPIWKVFVGNRVANTLEYVPASQWFHVPSKDNPADHASRGLRPRDLLACQQWWRGPEWMQQPMECWPIKPVRPSVLSDPDVLSEARTASLQVTVSSPLTKGCRSLENRFSSATVLQNVVAYCLRYINKLKVRRTPEQRLCLSDHYRTVKLKLLDRSLVVTPLTTIERSNALDVLVRRCQAQALSKELADAQSERPKFKICRTLGLFVDAGGILRVGGRLRNSQLPDSVKHPALLPSEHVLTRLLIERTHRSLLHSGPLSTLHHLRYNFWIVNGKNVVRRQLNQCVDCYTIRPKPFQPEMGQLPFGRTQLDSPFATTGVDYAGPFPVSIAGLRGNKILNCYLAIFVCFAVKAVHIEVVTDLSTPGFLQAYSRFTSRRGQPHTVWSDNGRNFLGAANELRRVQALLQNNEHQSAVIRESARNGTTWKFIPPSAPFFGGLWEAAVKQAKRLLKNCLRDQLPTLETFTTIVTQIEAVLNSRPLTAMSSSPNDLAVLTPAHFLIFRPLTMPASDPDPAHRNLRERHKFSQHVVQNFWHRWRKEYLLELQSRSKWDRTERPARVGDLVLIINDNSPPLTWNMGLILKLYPGPDGVARVADVRTAAGTISRPVRKLCPLPEDVCGAIAPTAGEDVASLPCKYLPTTESAASILQPH